jgi:cytidylate kinase
VRCSVVCISRPDGAGGASVGHLVAERLEFDYVDEVIVSRAAAKGGIAAGDVVDEEQRKSLLGRIVREIGRTTGPDSYGFGGLSDLYIEGVTPEAVRSLIQDAIEETAGRGDVVIVSHAASLALSARPNVLRVLVTASPETRARRLSESQGLDPKAARKTIKDADAARADYLRRFYGVEVELPTHYDLVVNTDTLSIEQAVDLVAQAAS